MAHQSSLGLVVVVVVEEEARAGQGEDNATIQEVHSNVSMYTRSC